MAHAPARQTLIVTERCVGRSVGASRSKSIRPGGVIWIPPGEKHWHGAASITRMTHIAVQEQLDGKAADWVEQVSDEQYRA
jgi:quercetin dioxygenase-like cupin family protein